MKLAMPAHYFRKFERCFYFYQRPDRLFFTKKIHKCTYQEREKVKETGKEAFQLRLWDARIGRWLSPDPAGKGDSPYTGMYNNPLKYIDPDGADTLNVYRSKLLSLRGVKDSYGTTTTYGACRLNFTIIKNGKRLKQKLVLYTNHDYENLGLNELNHKKVFKARFKQMGDHENEKGWENIINIMNFINNPENSVIYLHPEDPLWNSGCKAVCRKDNVPFGPGKYDETFKATQEGLQDIRNLYNTTDRQGFFFITGFNMPASPIPKPSSQPIRKGWVSFEATPTLSFPKD